MENSATPQPTPLSKTAARSRSTPSLNTSSKAMAILGCTPEQVRRSKALTRLGVSEPELLLLDGDDPAFKESRPRSRRVRKHRKRKSATLEEESLQLLDESPKPRKRAATTPNASDSTTASYTFQRPLERIDEDDVDMADAPRPLSRGVSELKLDKRTGLRRFVRARRVTGDAREAFKRVVENNLHKRGYHTRTRSGTVPVLKYTPGRRVRAKTKSIDFESFLKSRTGYLHLLKHLKSEYAEENLEFWQAVEEYRDEPSVQSANYIYTRFVKQGSEREINLPCEIRTPLDEAHAADWGEDGATATLFDRAQREIYALIQRDSMTRFKGSDAFDAYIADA